MSDRAIPVNAQAVETAEDTEDTREAGNGGGRTLGPWPWLVVVAILVALLVVAIARVLPTVVTGQADEATSAAVVTGIATLLLVIITWKYVGETQALVNLSREQRQMQEQERKARIRSFRTALYEEIGTERSWGRFRRILAGHGSISQPVPTQVYKTTPWRVGQLTEDERIVIVKYYNSVFNLRQLLERTPSAELTTDEGEVVKPIEDQITMINDLQDQALKAIEQNLDDSE